MRFGAPTHLWLLCLVPLLALLGGWALVRKRRALALFAHRAMVPRLAQQFSPGRQYARYLLMLGGVFFLVMALAAPQFGATAEMAKRRGADVVVALDVSRSMLAADVKPSRLERARHQIDELLDRLRGDRVGLVVFAGHAFIQCPLTLDYGAMRMFLELAGTRSVPVQGTALGDAIRMAERCFETGEGRDKAVVLFTDGESHLGDPVGVAREAGTRGVRIFAVGLGTPEGELIPEPQGGGYHQDEQGNYIKSRLDEETLEQVALASDGAYFRSSLGGAELDELYAHLARLEQREFGAARFTQYEERFQLFLVPALLCFLAEALLPEGRRRSGEWRGRFT